MSALAKPSLTRALGASGIQVSSLGWGMWRFQGSDVTAARLLIETALDAGITLFDTADIYGPDNGEPFGAAETLLGRVLAEAPALRGRMTLATKGGIVIGAPYDSSPVYLESAIDASLTRLGVERIDLWQIHRPDVLTHPHEIARAIEKIHASGKIRAFGVSNFTPAQTLAMGAAFREAGIAVSTIQPELSPLTLTPIEDGTLDLAMTHDLCPLAWSPLGQGRVAEPVTERERAVADALDHVAQAQGVSRTAAAYSWIMAHPARPIPIVGSQQPERIRDATAALTVEWTRASWYKVLVASREEPLP